MFSSGLIWICFVIKTVCCRLGFFLFLELVDGFTLHCTAAGWSGVQSWEEEELLWKFVCFSTFKLQKLEILMNFHLFSIWHRERIVDHDCTFFGVERFSSVPNRWSFRLDTLVIFYEMVNHMFEWLFIFPNITLRGNIYVVQ